MPKTGSIRPVVSIQHRLATDGQTDGRTHDDSMHRASIASRDKLSALADGPARRVASRHRERTTVDAR